MRAVAIDGPAGAGKTTVARAVADKLGWSYVDTGAMYRTLALAVLVEHGDPHDPSAVTEVAERVDIDVLEGAPTLGGRPVGDRIRDPDVTQASAVVSQHPATREVLVALQRRAARKGHVVMEGRDIGTVVLPEADVKVFLTATLEQRAARRVQETNDAVEPDAIRSDIAERDRSDQERVISPLKRAPGAVVIDTTDKTIEQVVDEIVELAFRAQQVE